jgi:probable rRNA maturation factor
VIIVRSKVQGVKARALSRFVVQAQRAARVVGEVDVLITSSAQMRRLNRDFRGQNEATDVLSFPSIDRTGGDLAISAEIGARRARCLGHSLLDELKVLILHGLLHLGGYDHETDSGEMARKEARLRRAFGLPTTLVERTTLSAEVRRTSGTYNGRSRQP